MGNLVESGTFQTVDVEARGQSVDVERIQGRAKGVSVARVCKDVCVYSWNTWVEHSQENLGSRRSRLAMILLEELGEISKSCCQAGNWR